MTATLHPLPPGTLLPDGAGETGIYRIVEHIADGGMSSIYKVDVKGRNDGPFALKVNHLPHRVPTLFREAWWQSQGHRGVVPSYWPDHTQINEQRIAVFVMPFLREGNMVNKIYSRTYTRLDAINWIHGISESLGSMGCIHRDLKPENILFFGRQPLVVDFGLAVCADAADRARWGEEILVSGTASYMSPEQHLYLRIKELDVRSDIYALTLMLHELWHGVLPFPIDLPLDDLVARKISGDVKPTDTGVPEVNALMEKGMAVKRADRHQTHGEFCRDLLKIDSLILGQ